MKVSWHPERRLFVLSMWHGDTCTGTFRLPLGEVPRLVWTLVDVLGHTAESASGPASAGQSSETLPGRVRAWSRTVPAVWRGRDRRSQG